MNENKDTLSKEERDEVNRLTETLIRACDGNPANRVLLASLQVAFTACSIKGMSVNKIRNTVSESLVMWIKNQSS